MSIRLAPIKHTVMQPCSVRHTARKAPIPCYGLLKHAAEARPRHTHTRRDTHSVHKPHICQHDIRAHKSKGHRGSFASGLQNKGEKRSEARCLSIMRHKSELHAIPDNLLYCCKLKHIADSPCGQLLS